MDSPSTDRSLMRRLRDGDKRAADQLHSRYSSRLRGLVKGRWNRVLSSRVDIDDIVQSALGSFFRAARQGAYQVPQGGELWQLLAAITRHKLSHARVKHLAAKRDARRTVSCREAVGSLAGEEERLAQELRLLIEDMIRGFSPTERKIVELRIEGYELHDIAERTARSRRTVERVLQGFREDLLRAYQADGRD